MSRNEANITTIRIAWNLPAMHQPGQSGDDATILRSSFDLRVVGNNARGGGFDWLLGLRIHSLDLTPNGAECHSHQQVFLEEKDHQNRWQYVDERDGGNE